LSENRSAINNLAIKHSISQIIISTNIVNPVNHSIITIRWIRTFAWWISYIIIKEISIAEGRVSGVVDISSIWTSQVHISYETQLRRRKSEIIENHVIWKQASPKLNPTLKSICLGHKSHRHHMILSISRFSSHQIQLSRLISQGNSRYQISSNRYIQHNDSSYWTWNLKDYKSNKREHLSYLRSQSITYRFLNIIIYFPTLLDTHHYWTEVIIEKNHVSCVFCHLSACYTHWHSYICFFYCWRIIYTVTCYCHYFSKFLTSFHND